MQLWNETWKLKLLQKTILVRKTLYEKKGTRIEKEKKEIILAIRIIHTYYLPSFKQDL